ncbi:bifunctional aspartate kinase/homoserine dehydrogenase I [Robiginitalea aurantiaca]|uniref:Bifunctional aspartate kinase/homoserine dehydrogenase I n=1 Tax=Robiginitalea aurantiaca TaxID=3056915 RepID=A0ABT7WHS1_9FLAO|nr:bifunctional aspartate kinase/homoserine dehydrogenase I [Robiginitalea aurantiaca]MDM9632472.1 bifunctional aspartate kinase/homoserine dehydrogenase I [Robiginitalea aurantiaca]
MRVLKFGGSSVAGPEAISATLEIVSRSETPVFVVVSALGGVTDLLLEATFHAADQREEWRESLEEIETRYLNTVRGLLPVAEHAPVLSKVKKELNTLETLLEGAYLIGESTPKLRDKIVSFGELLSAFIIAKFYKSKGLNAVFQDSRELILTDDTFGNARVNQEKTETKIKAVLRGTDPVVVLPGFIASNGEGDTTTLGRGGSDYSAALIAGALRADLLEIWTDVSGMFTANPRLVKGARPIPTLSYEEAMELSHFGAKVLYPPTIRPAFQAGIPILIKNTFSPDEPGTLIESDGNPHGRTVRGISYVPGIALLSLEGPGMIGIPGISNRFFKVLSQKGINIVFITQASSEHSICVGINENQASIAAREVNRAFDREIEKGEIYPVKEEKDLSIVALVGDRMKEHQGLSGRMFSTLGRNNVNIRAIAQGASERNISAVIRSVDVKKALNTLHETFFEEQVKQLNLFVMGVGNVGARLLNQIRDQQKFLKKEHRLLIRVVGISNSRKMVYRQSGIPLARWKSELEEGTAASPQAFYDVVRNANLRNSVFIDNTASAEISGWYSKYLQESVAVVTCNKIACSSVYSGYLKLKALSRTYGVPFLFETNVGAGLPVIDTLKNLILSGDRVRKIQAVLSGSLNFIFNTYDGSEPFANVVREAQLQGFTEPDPRIDLSGVDVMRKILILARESGLELELQDIENHSFLPEGAGDSADIDAFYNTLERGEPHFKTLLSAAKKKGARLKYVAELNNGKASVGLEEIPEGHDFYNLRGSDNIVLFYTDRYPEQPLMIKGAGAGAEVTASGLFADIIRTGNY